MKILMVLISFLNFVIAPIFSNDAAASSNTKKRYSRARRTKLGSRSGGTSSQKKRQEQNLMEDFSRFVFSTYGKTLQYGQSYNLQDMLKYDVNKYYKENGSEQDLNEKFCFGPYMKLTSNVSGPGGEAIDLKAGDRTICTYIKPNTNYAISLTDATEKQISQAVKKNATPCMTSVDKRRVCITRNGQDLQTMHLTSEIYLDTKPYISQITDAIGKVKTSCGEFTKQMASINDKMGLGVPLTSGLGMALSGAATAVGYMNYKATNEQDELLAEYGSNQRKFVEAILNSKLEKRSNFPTQEELEKQDWTKDVNITDWFVKPNGEEPELPKKEPVHTEEHKALCEIFLEFKKQETDKIYIREMVDGAGEKSNYCKTKEPLKDYSNYICIRETQRKGGIPGEHPYFVFKNIVKRVFFETDEEFKNEVVSRDAIERYLIKVGTCCKDGWQASSDKESVCIYPGIETTETNEDALKDAKTEYENEMRKLLDMQNKLKADGSAVKAINANHKKSRTLDITTAALSGTSAITSTISMGLSVSTIETIKKSLETLKECKKAVRDLKVLNNKYVAEQNQAEGE